MISIGLGKEPDRKHRKHRTEGEVMVNCRIIYLETWKRIVEMQKISRDAMKFG